MPLNDADLLDIVRKLRTYMSTIDNVHHVFEQTLSIEDSIISSTIEKTVPELITMAMKISQILRLIETSRGYRRMAANYHIDDEVSNAE